MAFGEHSKTERRSTTKTNISAKGVTASTRKGRYSLDARRALQPQRAKGVTGSISRFSTINDTFLCCILQRIPALLIIWLHQWPLKLRAWATRMQFRKAFFPHGLYS